MTSSVCCSVWNCSFYNFGLQCDSNNSITNALIDPFLGEINIWSGVPDTSEGRGSATLSEKKHLMNVWGISSRLRSDTPKSMMPVSR